MDKKQVNDEFHNCRLFIYLFILGLLNDAVRSVVYTASNI
jgi:hypothetical protein